MSRLLFADDYGAYAVASWIVGLGAFFGDVGLAGALVRQPTKPTINESFTVFIAQQLLTVVVIVMVVTLGPKLAGVSAVAADDRRLLYLMSLSLFMSSLRIIPMLALERELKFGVIAKIELAQNVLNTLTNIFLAWLGWGPWSLAVGAVVGAGVMTTGVWMASPWRPAGKFEWPIVKRLAGFGIAFQLNALMPTLLSGWVFIIVGKMLGVSAVGFVTWAVSLSSVPLMVSGVLNRIAFPTYSRLQNDPAVLGHYLKASIRRLMAVMIVFVPAGVLLCPLLIPTLFDPRWNPAVPLVQWFSIDVMLATILGVLASSQNATGHATDRLWITIGSGIIRWIAGFAIVYLFGLQGVGPLVAAITLIELVVTCVLIEKRNPSIHKLLTTVMDPILRMGIALTIAWLSSFLISPDHPAARCLLALGIFSGLLFFHELLTSGKLVWLDLQALSHMIKGRVSAGSVAK